MRLLLTGIFAVVMSLAATAATINFSGYTWVIRPSGRGGPGPNHWEQENVFVDTNGFLHLRLSHQGDQWHCAEVYTQKRLGFGHYEFWLEGPVDKMDRNVVLGLFNYPTSDVGPDGTHEIDIEFAQWGNPSAPMGNYTVWPSTTKVKQKSKSFSFALNGEASTHQFTWGPTNVLFQSLYGHSDYDNHPFATWLYQPTNAASFLSQQPMPVHINL